MYGLYQQTIKRNGKTTVFTVQPLTQCEYSKDGLITCCGAIGYYDYKMPISLTGTFDENAIFHVKSDCMPIGTKKEDKLLLAYIAPWLSESKCNKLSGKLKDATLKTFLECGLDKLQSKKIAENIKRIKGNEKLIQLLTAYGIKRDYIDVLIKKGVTYHSFLNNPYSVTRISEIDFLTVDTIALQVFKLTPYSFMRLCAFTRYIMDLYIKNGDTCILAENFQYAINQKFKKSSTPEVCMTAALFITCTQSLEFVTEEYNHKLYFYDKKIAKEENDLISHICRLQNSKQVRTIPDISEIEKELQITYTEGQRNAFQILGSTGIKILTGPPGSGKTAVIRGLIRNARSVKLAATTGRAAQVMKKSCKKQAVTTYKLLDIQPYGENLSSKNINNPILADIIIIDEVSMMGLKIASQLLQAVKNNSILLLVGDEDQLQSVEYGNVLSDLIHSGVIELYRLTEVKRQSGSILKNAQLVNSGENDLIEDSKFHLISAETEEEAFDKMLSYIKEDSQVLTTVKKELLGTKKLNNVLQKKNKEFCVAFGNVDYYIGNRVIMTETNYENGYYNGDMGVVLGMKGNGLMVQFEEKTLCLTRDDLACMELAYAITTHKAQGSEFPIVHIILPKSFPIMLTRRMLYTAITRASQEVFLYSVENSSDVAIQNSYERKRVILLGEKLKKILSK